MATALESPQSPIIQANQEILNTSGFCSHIFKDKWEIVEIVIEVALGIFAACLAWELLLVSAAIGALYQIILIAGDWTVWPDKECACDAKKSVSCGESDGTRYMGRSLLRHEIILLPAVYFFLHLRHEPESFVPLLGAYIGARVVWLIYKQIKECSPRQVVLEVQPNTATTPNNAPRIETEHHHEHAHHGHCDEDTIESAQPASATV